MENLSNIAAERAVLAGIFKWGADAYTDVEDLLKVESFYSESSQGIYKCIQKIFEKDPNSKIDLTTILSTSKELGIGELFSEKSQVQYLRSISSLDISAENIRKEAIKLVKLHATRIAYDKMEESQRELCKITGSESMSSIMAIIEKPANDLASSLEKEGDKTGKMGDGAEIWIENIFNNPRDNVGISTGFGILDVAIGGGIRRKTVNLVAARAKCGKSSLVDATGMHVSGKLNIPTLNIDTEMDKESHLARICANLTEIPITLIEKGKLTDKQKKEVKDAIKYIQSAPYYYRCVAGYSFEEILSIIKRWILKEVGTENGRTKDCLVIYDYFKLMNSDDLKSAQEYQLLGFQLSELNNFAIKYDFPCLSFAQTNRDGVSEESIDTIAGSDRLSWFAASVSILKKKTPEEITQDGIENGNRKLIPLVARYGPCLEDGDYININMRGEFCQLRELGTRNSAYKKKKQEEIETVAF